MGQKGPRRFFEIGDRLPAVIRAAARARITPSHQRGKIIGGGPAHRYGGIFLDEDGVVGVRFLLLSLRSSIIVIGIVWSKAIVPRLLVPALSWTFRLVLSKMARREIQRPIEVGCPCCQQEFQLDASSELRRSSGDDHLAFDESATEPSAEGAKSTFAGAVCARGRDARPTAAPTVRCTDPSSSRRCRPVWRRGDGERGRGRRGWILNG